MVHCCLDRVMANSCWFSEFPAYEMVFLELGESDHRPLVTYLSSDREQPRKTFSMIFVCIIKRVSRKLFTEL